MTEDRPQRPITAKQQEALDAIQAWQAAHGQPPSRRELAKKLGCSCTAAQQRVSQLEAKGAIERERWAVRGLAIAQPKLPRKGKAKGV